ncbi:MAG: hypothetical protein KatS3mg129_0887 [Leptospiraceae bacterium]|nr:MAG: hypothetical protein KatS3mg129_0887 [Leptospiraceae bacterium]
MNKNLYLILILIIFFVFLFYCKQKETDIIPEPKIKAQVENDILKVIIQLPKNHHAYLDKGKDGMLIPITFDWSDFIEKNILSQEPTLITKPKGEYDDEVKATVLRGDGIFEFQLPDSLLSETLKKGNLKIKIQICNETSGICYRPKIYNINF